MQPEQGGSGAASRTMPPSVTLAGGSGASHLDHPSEMRSYVWSLPHGISEMVASVWALSAGLDEM